MMVKVDVHNSIYYLIHYSYLVVSSRSCNQGRKGRSWEVTGKVIRVLMNVLQREVWSGGSGGWWLRSWTYMVGPWTPGSVERVMVVGSRVYVVGLAVLVGRTVDVVVFSERCRRRLLDSVTP